jgi:hypothetical protein
MDVEDQVSTSSVKEEEAKLPRSITEKNILYTLNEKDEETAPYRI